MAFAPIEENKQALNQLKSIQNEKEIIKLKRTEPLTDYEKNFSNYNPEIHKVGWVTWIEKESYDSRC